MVAKGSNCPMWRPSATLFITTEQLYSTPPNCSHQRPVLLLCIPVWLTSTVGGVMNIPPGEVPFTPGNKGGAGQICPAAEPDVFDHT
jgi:hypothetical protein